MAGYSIVLGVAAVTTFLLTFIVRKVAVRIGAMSHPGPRSVHAKATPSLGGAAMFAAFLAAMAVASQIPQFHAMFHNSSEPVGLMLAAAVIFVVGAVDDLREVSPPAKVAGMVLAGGILSLFGVSMLYFRVPFASYDYVVLSADLAPLVTVVTVVLMANALNLIDGLDGLAAGIVAIAGAALFLYSDRLFKAGLLEGSNIAPLIAVIAVGVCIGFLPHNFNPARIFMGDAGAMFLGLLMATMTITVGGRTADQFTGQTYFFFAPLFIPLLILGVPIVDTAFSFFRRVAAAPGISRGRQRPLASPTDAVGPWAPPHRRDPVAVDRAAVGNGPDTDLHEPRQRARARRRRRARSAPVRLLPPRQAGRTTRLSTCRNKPPRRLTPRRRPRRATRSSTSRRGVAPQAGGRAERALRRARPRLDRRKRRPLTLRIHSQAPSGS